MNKNDSVDIDVGLQIICKLFDIKKLKSYQRKTFEALYLKNDCFVCQPTGSGKSITFQAFPYFKHAMDLTKNEELPEDPNSIRETCPYKIVVISPLNSLMSDQKNQLSRKGYKVCCLKSCHGSNQYEEYLKEVKESNIIFTSPELILTSYRHIFREDVIQRNLVTFAVDESHCIKYWGSSSDKANAFRENYSQLSELRSLVLNDVPILALTATATKDTKEHIIDNLCMIQPTVISSSPERQNIKFCSIHLKERDIERFFEPVVKALSSNNYGTEKILIFCRVMKDVRDIYRLFDNIFREKFSSYSTRPYAMFHSKTEELIKSHVLQEFSKSNGIVRVLVSTIAFGMGVNCKGLSNIVHFGPPASLEDYFQQAGRAGRDGSQSNAVLATYPRSTGSKNITESIKKYAKNKVTCRRKLIFEEFGENYNVLELKHLCCDVCEVDCKCGSCPSSERWWDQKTTDDSQINNKTTSLWKGQQKFIQNGLIDIRKSIISPFKGVCGSNITSGFPIESIQEILNIASPNMTELDVKRDTCIFNEEIYSDIVSLVRQSFQFEDEYDIISDQSDVSSTKDATDDEGLSDLESSIDSVDSAVDFHTNLRVFSDSDSE